MAERSRPHGARKPPRPGPVGPRPPLYVVPDPPRPERLIYSHACLTREERGEE